MATRVPAASTGSTASRGGPVVSAAVAAPRPLRARLVEPSAAPVQAATDEVVLVDLAEAARRLATSPRSLRRLAASGAVLYVRVGRALKFRPRDLHTFADAHLVGGAR